jgi:hypothetical protein
MALPDTRRLEDLAIEPLSELCKEAYEETAWALENTLKKAVHFGRLLCIAKTKVPHGQWIPWVTETFEDQVSLRNIQRFMQVAESNTTDPSLLEGAKNLDEAMGLIQVKKTSVEVIEVAADVPVAAEIVTEDKPAVEAITAVTTVKPVVSKPVTATAEPEVEKKSPTVIQIQRTLIKMGKDKKRHPQVMQIANDALHRLTLQDRGMVICKQLLSMKPEERDMVYASVDHMMKKEKPDQLGS